MVSGWKRKMLKMLLFLHLFLMVGGVLSWGKGYVSLAYHKHQGVLYEIPALLAPSPYNPWLHRVPQVMFPLETNAIQVVWVNDPEEPRLILLIIWQGTLEENLRTLQPPEAVNSLVWVEGVERSGNKEPTLIAWGTVDLTGLWWFDLSYIAPPIQGVGEFSQRIYNLGRLWLIFYSFRDPSGNYIEPRFDIMHTARRQRLKIYLNYFNKRVSWWEEGEKLTPTDILERIRLYRPGVMPIGYRLGFLRTAPTECDIFWLFPKPRGGSGIWEYYWVILYPLGIAATPYRYLAYLPLMVVPRVLVWPVAVLWGMLLLASWVWGVVAYRRWR